MKPIYTATFTSGDKKAQAEINLFTFESFGEHQYKVEFRSEELNLKKICSYSEALEYIDTCSMKWLDILKKQ